MTVAPTRDPLAAASETMRRSLHGWLEMCATTTRVGFDYWQGAASRGATLPDVAADWLRWNRLVTDRSRPTWSTPNEVIERSPIAALRDFSGGVETGVTPTLILPPQAGHDSCIVDYSPTQSQVLTAKAAGLTRLYVLEWLEATSATKHCSIDDYLAVIRSAIQRIGGPVNLIGDCQGGWLATVYAAVHPADVASLTIGGAPIDFHAGDAAIADFVKLMGGMDFYRAAVRLGDGLYKGASMLQGFIAMQPETELKKHLELLLHLDDEAYVRRYAEFQDWYAHTQDISGAFYLWIVENLFLENRLVKGTLEIGGKRVDLGAITCPVNLLAGSEDHITPAEQVFALAHHVSTDPEQIHERLTGGGHLGLFMSRSALAEEWLPLLQGVAAAG